MSAAGGGDELRALRRKAWGRDAGLSSAESARLQELEEQAARGARGPATEAASAESDAAQSMTTDGLPGQTGLAFVVPPLPGSGSAVETEVAGVGADGSRDAAHGQSSQLRATGRPPSDARASGEAARVAGPSGADQDGEGSAAGGVVRPDGAAAGSAGRPRPLVLALAAAALLLGGGGIGWMLAGGAVGEAVLLSPQQQAWQDDIVASGQYDAGSVRAVTVAEETVVWTATQDQHERTCLILGTGDLTMPSCDRTSSVAERGLYGSIHLGTDGDLQRQLSAQLLLTASGEPAVAVSASDYTTDVTAIEYANEDETRTARRLAEEGFDPGSIWVAGYDGDTPIWTASQLESGRQCLIHDGSTPDSPMACETVETLGEYDRGLMLEVTDPQSGALTRYEIPWSRGPSTLVISHEGGAAGAGGD